MAFLPPRKIRIIVAALLLSAPSAWAQRAFEEAMTKAEAGDAEAMGTVADMYFDGHWGPKQDVATGLTWLRKSAEAGYVDAQVELADLYFKAKGPGYPAADRAEAFKWYALAAKQDSEKAVGMVAGFYQRGEAFTLMRQAAASGNDKTAALLLGQMYAEGRGTPKNIIEASRWLAQAKFLEADGAEKAFEDFKNANPDLMDKVIAAASPAIQQAFVKAKDGNNDARYELGEAYYHGTGGVPQDRDQGMQWLKYAGEQGLARARKKYAEYLDVAGRHKEALAMYQSLADSFDADAQYIVAQHYATGSGTDKDPDAAFRWYRFSAQGKDLRGIKALARELIARDDGEASVWLERGAETGDAEAVKMLADYRQQRTQSPIVVGAPAPSAPAAAPVQTAASSAAITEALARARRQFELGFDTADGDVERKLVTKWFSEDVSAVMATTSLSKTDGTDFLLTALLPRLDKRPDMSYPCISVLSSSTFDLTRVREMASPAVRTAIANEADSVSKSLDAATQFLRANKPLFDRAESGDAEAEYQVGAIYASGTVMHDPDSTLVWFKKAAAHGQKSAAKILASLSGPPFNAAGTAAKAGQMPLALVKFRIAAELGEVEANFWIGYIHSLGYEGVAPNPEKALTYYRTAADAGVALAMVELGKAYAWGQMGVKADPAEGGRWFRKAADTGHPGGQTMLAECYLWGEAGFAKSDADALQWFRAAAKQTNLAAALWIILIENCPSDGDRQVQALGYAERGVHESTNLDDAVYWLGKAERFGFAPAHAWIAANEKLGTKFPAAQIREDGATAYEAKKMPEAVALWQKAAEAGNPNAMLDLGTSYFYGEGVPKDRKAGVAWYQKSAAMGYFPAQFKLREAESVEVLQAAVDLHGAGKKDEARPKFAQAAALGSENAMYDLGALYENGDGVPQDLPHALMMYTRAEALMQQDAGDAATRVKNRLIDRANVELGQSSLRANRFAIAQVAFEAASAAGNPEAMLDLGLTYETRTDGLADNAKALSCYDVAAELDYPNAKELAAKLRAKMAAAGIAKPETKPAFTPKTPAK